MKHTSHIEKARRLKAAELIDAIFDEHTARLEGAFVDAATRVREQVGRRQLARALDAGDVTGAIRLVEEANLPGLLEGVGLPTEQKPVSDLIRDVYLAGGAMGAKQLPKAIAEQAKFDWTNPRSAEWMRDRIGSLVTLVSTEQREAIQELVTRAFSEGRTGYQTAVEIRETIGLTAQQRQAVANFRRQLEAKAVGGHTAPWDRRLSAAESAMARAEFNAPAVNRSRVNDLVERYSQRLLNRRAEDIARTEIHNAAIQGQAEQWRQATEQGLLDPETTRRVWIPTPDTRLREEHRAVPRMNEKGVPLDEPFDTPVGPIMHPGEGPADFTINCRCSEGLRFVD